MIVRAIAVPPRSLRAGVGLALGRLLLSRTQVLRLRVGALRTLLLGASVSTCAARPPLLPAARRCGGIRRPGRGDVAEAVSAAVARSGTPAPAKGAFTAEKRPLLPAGWLSVAGVILRLGHSSCCARSCVRGPKCRRIVRAPVSAAALTDS